MKPSSPSPQQPGSQRVIDLIVLLFCAVLVGGRCMINEAFPVNWRVAGPPVGPTLTFGEATAMSTFSTLAFVVAGVWLALRWGFGRTAWRRTGLLIPLLLFAAAALLSWQAASNKHTAMITAMTLLSQLTVALLLVQVLNTPHRRRLLLCVVAAVGVVTAYRCWEQHTYEIPSLVEDFEENAATTLAREGIEDGTYQAAQFRERLASKDIGGFFAISNSAAAFFILALTAASALLLPALRPLKSPRLVLAATVLIVGQFAGLFLTQSKGGIGALFVAIVLFAALFMTRRQLKRHWRGALFVAAILVVLGVIAIVAYGMTYDRLPTASMWVRWHYWRASGAMLTDHWLQGVGPDNFGHYYPRYMNPAAPEVVKDPHCFPLAIWTQWGLLGFVGLLWAITAATIRLARPHEELTDDIPPADPLCTNRNIWIIATVLAVGITFLRLSVTNLGDEANSDARSAIYLVSFIIPAILWWLSFLLFWHVGNNSEKPSAGAVLLLLSCGLLGFLLHNCIDFAIFQPGLGMCFAALLAVALARRADGQPTTKTPATLIRVVVLALIGIVVVLNIIITSRTGRTAHILHSQQARVLKAYDPMQQQLTFNPQAAQQHYRNELTAALERVRTVAEEDLYNPDPWMFVANGTYQQWQMSGRKREYLHQSIDALNEARRRDPQRSKYFRRLLDACLLLHDAPELVLLEYAEAALERAPGDVELLVKYADLLADAGMMEQARRAYRKALAIEDAFLEMQTALWPERETPYPRLPPKLRRHAEQQLLNGAATDHP